MLRTQTPSMSTGPLGEPSMSPSSEIDGLDDRALLTLILSRTMSAAASATTARQLLCRFASLGEVVAADPGEIGRMATPDAIKDLKLIRELAIRLARIEACHRPVISSWSAMLAYLRAALAHEPREQFRALYLDRRNILIQDEFVATGTVDHAPVYPREVVRRALELSASAIILVHNHPSGDPAPSRADIDMTRKIIDAAQVFSIQVHDHVVVGREGTASFKSLGLM